MSTPATQLSEYLGLATGKPQENAYRPPHRSPEILARIYASLRGMVPLLALTSVSMPAQLPHQSWLHTATSATFAPPSVFTLVVLMIAWNCIFGASKKEGRDTPRVDFLLSQLGAVLAGTCACTAILWASESVFAGGGSRAMFPGEFVLRCAAMGVGCVLAAALTYSIAYRLSPQQLYVVLGSRRRAIAAYRKLRSQGICRGHVLGFIDPDDSHAKYLPCDYLGSLDQLERILIQNPVDLVYFALPLKSCYDTVQEAISICERIGVEYSVQPDIFETRLGRLGRLPLREVRGTGYHIGHEDYRILLKQAIDMVCAIILLAILSPLMIVIAVAIKLTSPGPVLFVQERYGRNRRRFRIFKFRSMVEDAEQLMTDVEELNEAKGPIFKIKNDPRITKVGRLLRKTSLDELPQLFNIVKGDMSLVGPRPMSLRDVHRFPEASLMRRFSVSPGITGLWQVSGRSNTDFDTWIRLDLQYIDEWSLGLDLKILLRTVPTVLSGAGAA
jgi:exopolysaccharide biosynthesis polyprenyl glycosylphosphotransferase